MTNQHKSKIERHGPKARTWKNIDTHEHLKIPLSLGSWYTAITKSLGHSPHLEIILSGEGNNTVSTWGPGCEVSPPFSPPKYVCGKDGSSCQVFEDTTYWHGKQPTDIELYRVAELPQNAVTDQTATKPLITTIPVPRMD